jgi:hypothetical protein
MMERMFIPRGEGEKPKFDILAWARNVCRRSQSDETTLYIARKLLKEAGELAPEVDKSDAYRRYQKLVTDEFWKEHGLDVDNQLSQRFSAEPNPRAEPVHDSAPLSSERSFARFLLLGNLTDAINAAAQRLVKQPYGSLQVEAFLTPDYWQHLEARVRSQLNPMRVTKPKPVEPEPARELSDGEVDALLPVDEDARLRALFV